MVRRVNLLSNSRGHLFSLAPCLAYYRTTVFRSNVVKSNLNPIWEEDTLDMEALCNGDQ